MSCKCKRKNPFIKAPSGSSKAAPRALRGALGSGAAYLFGKLFFSKAWPVTSARPVQLFLAGLAAQKLYPGKTAANAFAGGLGYAAFAAWEHEAHTKQLRTAGIGYDDARAQSYRRRLALPELGA